MAILILSPNCLKQIQTVISNSRAPPLFTVFPIQVLHLKREEKKGRKKKPLLTNQKVLLIRGLEEIELQKKQQALKEQQERVTVITHHTFFINRPGVAGVVLQAPFSLIQ